MSEQDIKKMEKDYLYAKRQYYKGDPVMTDAEFDELEKRLKEAGSRVTSIVGDGKVGEAPHPSPMLSLDKISPDEDQAGELVQWAQEKDLQKLIFEPKLDGVSMNLVYRDGKLVSAITRGDGEYGYDQLNKMIHAGVPQNIDPEGTVEVRGEVVIPVSTFYERYNYKNPRNFVAGILSRDGVPDECRDLKLFVFDIRKNGKHTQINLFNDEGDDTFFGNAENTLLPTQGVIVQVDKGGIQDTIGKLKDHYKGMDYQTDGLVVKSFPEKRDELGEDHHSPNWGIAVKFDAETYSTQLRDIEWNTRSTGEIIPKAIMDPVTIDGTDVSRATLFNWGWVRDQRIGPGAQVEVYKAGDIVPQVNSVLTSGEEDPVPPKECPTCGTSTVENGIHLECPNDQCDAKILTILRKSVEALGIYELGEKTLHKLMETGIKNVADLYNPSIFNRERIQNDTGIQGDRQIDIILQAPYNINRIKLEDIIKAAGPVGVGGRMAKEIAKWMKGVPYNFSGFDGKVLRDGTRKEALLTYKQLSTKLHQNGVQVEEPQKASAKFEMTGSPNVEGFGKKDEIKKFLEDQGYEKTGISDADILLTDDPEGNTGKMKKARDKGIRIATYQEIINENN